MNLQPHDGMLLVTSREQIARARTTMAASLPPCTAGAAWRCSQAGALR
jgi:hypothetical protein